MEEIWRDIPDYEGIYQVSNLGKVKSLNYNGTKKERNLILVINENSGYLRVCLCVKNKRKDFLVHQLVAMAFLGHMPNGHVMVINHKDINILNNNLNNLEIVTSRENSSKRTIKGTSKYTGVSWNKRLRKWVAQIHKEGRKKHLGCFSSEYEAYLSYKKAL